MSAYIIRRTLLIIPTLLLVTIIVFFLVRLIPGSVVDVMVAEMGHETQTGYRVTLEKAAEVIRHRLGLDVPLHVQYVRWLRNIFLHGDLGKSLWKGDDVTRMLIDRFPVSIELGVMAVLIGLVMSVPIGVYSAIRQNTIGDYLGRTFSIGLISLPHFWVGVMVMIFPSVYLNWTPPMRYIPFSEDPLGNLGMFIIPAAILGMVLSGATMRLSRTMMLEVLRQDYIRTAWSKGLKERLVIMRHALKNALIPVITLVGLQVPILIGGSIVLEQIFNLPGIGRLTVEVIMDRDYLVLSGINLFMAFGVLVFNLIVDISYAYLDPRIQYK